MDTEKGYPRGFREDSLRPEIGRRTFRSDSVEFDEATELQQGEIRQEDSTYLALFKNIDSGNLEATKEFLDRDPEALTASLTSNGDTPIHKAVLSGHIKIVEEIIRRIQDPEQVLKMKNDHGYTALTYAATGGIVRIAECLVKKCPSLVSVRNAKEHIPIVVASLYGHKHLVRYLYNHTPLSDLNPCDDSEDEHKGKNGAMLVTNCIVDGLFGIALDLIQKFPKLAYTRDSDNDTAIIALAQTPSAFPSGTHLAFWQRWIYSCIHIGKVKNRHEVLTHHHHHYMKSGARNWIQEKLLKDLSFFFPYIRRIYKLKLGHVRAKEILKRMCQEMPNFDATQQRNAGLNQALFKAVDNGIVEYIEEMMRHYPDIVWFKDRNGLNLFFYAVSQRQEKIFSLIYNMGAKKNILATAWDKHNNNMLHHAAYRAPFSRLNLIPGATLQMQRELQWFKEVEKLVQPKHRKIANVKGKTPKTLFTEQHKDLVEQGEKWMKETATSCTVVAALITTMMFSSAFTVPGGYRSDNGKPLYVQKKIFKIFIISDAISLFTSCMSLLMFLGILKSRYREEDFLRSLPTKLIMGLLSLFLSMATMMVTFFVTLLTLVGQNGVSWISAQFLLLAVIPVGMFVVLQFPLLLEIFTSTYYPKVFDKPRQSHRMFKL